MTDCGRTTRSVNKYTRKIIKNFFSFSLVFNGAAFNHFCGGRKAIKVARFNVVTHWCVRDG